MATGIDCSMVLADAKAYFEVAHRLLEVKLTDDSPFAVPEIVALNDAFLAERDKCRTQALDVTRRLYVAGEAWGLDVKPLLGVLAALESPWYKDRMGGACGMLDSKPAQEKERGPADVVQLIQARANVLNVVESTRAAPGDLAPLSAGCPSDPQEREYGLERLDELRNALQGLLAGLESPANRPCKDRKAMALFLDLAFRNDENGRGWALTMWDEWSGDDPEESSKFRLALSRAFSIAMKCCFAHGPAALCDQSFGGVSVFAFKSDDAAEGHTAKIVFLLDHPPPLNFRDYPAICESLEVRKGQGSDLLQQVEALWPKLAKVVRQWFDAVDAQWRLAVKVEAGTDPHWIDGVGWAESAGPEGDAQADNMICAGIVLDPEDVTILQALAEAQTTQNQVDIEAATSISAKTVGKRLAKLRDAGYTHRPNGERSGEAITPKGREALAGRNGQAH